MMPEQSEEIRGGLLAEGKPIPLHGVSVEAFLKDFCARVIVSQRYRNVESVPIEAVYVFPLDEAAAVCGFEARIDNVHVVGEVKERDAAFEDYDEALLAGQGAYLLDQERPDVFTASIGNVPPGKEVMIRITYVAELDAAGDQLRFAIPTTVSPRYAPSEDLRGIGRTPAEALNPPLAWRVPYGLTLSVSLDMPSPIRAVESPSHPIGVEFAGTQGVVRLGEQQAALDRDFVLLVRLAEAYAPRSWVEADPTGTHVALLAFQPEFDSEQAPTEIIFVVDRSGSMGGTSIAEARNALQLCLRSLPEGTRFNIVGFGSEFHMLFPESRPYSEETLAAASAHVRGMDADLGGTEILAPLKAILAKPPHPEIPRQLFVLTDGQVTNTEAVLALIRKHENTTRVFSFGIGAGASHHLLRGMARAGGGAAEFIYPGERIEAKVLRQLRKALAPALTDIQVDWGGLTVTQAPFQVPPVFAGGRVLVYGFFADGRSGTVTLRAKSAKGRVALPIPINPTNAQSGTLLATLAARTMIRDLEEGASALHARGGSRQVRDKEDRTKAEIVRLGVTYQLCSSQTSFVAIEQRQTPVEGELQLRKVPIALTQGWGGLEEGMLSSASVVQCRSPAPKVPRDIGKSHLTPPLRVCADFKAAEPCFAPHAERPLDRLAALQRADGSWDLSPELAEILGRPLHELEEKIRDVTGIPEEVRRAWATALALVYLEQQAAEWRDEWGLLAEKAQRWLERCGANLGGGDTWPSAAGRVLSDM
jgi:Ca-activated chloride channel family protein